MAADKKITLNAGQFRPQAMVVVGPYLFLALRTMPAQLVRLNTSDLGGLQAITFPTELFHPDNPSSEKKFLPISDIAVIGNTLYCLHQASSHAVVTEVDAASMAWSVKIATESVNDTLSIAANGAKLLVSGYGQADNLNKGEISQFTVGQNEPEKKYLIPDVISQRPACRVFDSIYAVNGDKTTGNFSAMRFPDGSRVVSSVRFIQPWAPLTRLGDYIYVSTFGPTLGSSSQLLFRFRKDTLVFDAVPGDGSFIRGQWSDDNFLYLTKRTTAGAFSISRYDGAFKPVSVSERPEICCGDQQGNLYAGSWTDIVRGETNVPPAEVYKYSLASLFGGEPIPKPVYFIAGDGTSLTLSDGSKKWKMAATQV